MTAEAQKILIVDDYEMVRIMLKRCLNQLGYANVEEAVDGQQALEKLQSATEANSPFSMIFSDLNMPRMNGFELLSACRKAPAYQRLPFVIISAEAESDYISQALQHGANDYIIKPFSTQTLQKKLERINDLLKRSAASR
ncbi:MAG: response regulator [Oligoflexia bacterium]|nr:response regulator [Oligoflexia bacterium]